jgi:hypothetical protein
MAQARTEATLAGGGGASGIWGISDATGTYTYYDTIALAQAAASAGDTIELFADVTETSVTWNLLDNVSYNLNGHTYTLDESTGVNAITTNAITGETHIRNGRIVRRGNPTSGGNITYLTIYGSFTGKLFLHDTYIENDANACSRVSAGKIFGGIFYCSWNGGATITFGAIAGTGGPFYYNAIILSISALGIRGFGGYFYDCLVYTSNQTAVQLFNSNMELHRCQVIADGGVGIDQIASDSKIIDCTVDSSTSEAIVAGGKCEGTTVYSASDYGIRSSGSGGRIRNCHARSDASYAYYLNSGSAELNGSYGISQGGPAALVGNQKTYDCYLESQWNNVGGHAAVAFSGGTIDIFGCTLRVLNTGAHAISALLNPQNVKYGNNTIAGSPTVPINPNIVQAQVTNEDNFGNIVID